MTDCVESNCGVAKTLKIIGSKWTMLLLHNLFEGNKRFGQLERSMKGISPKTLSLRLRELEKAGIVKKKIFAEVPLHVEYDLTERGRELEAIFKIMARWGSEEKEKIDSRPTPRDYTTLA